MGKKCIGIDVGGTSVKIGLFETTGDLLLKWEVPTRKEEGGKYIIGGGLYLKDSGGEADPDGRGGRCRTGSSRTGYAGRLCGSMRKLRLA